MDDLGLRAAIEWQVEKFAKSSNVQVDLNLDCQEIKFNKESSTAIFRIIQEAMTNITRHAEASKVFLGMTSDNGSIQLVIKDNGKGISKKQMNDANSMGIISMQERVYLLGASIEISGNQGQGTTIKVDFPSANLEEEGGHD